MKPRYRPRFEPYTEIGIRRMPCSRCGKPSVYQWQVCANGIRGRNIFQCMCAECDIALNAMVLKFMRDPQAKAKMVRYRARVRRKLI